MMFQSCPIASAIGLTELRKTGQQGQFVILGEYADLSWWGNYAALASEARSKNYGDPESGQTIGRDDQFRQKSRHL